MASMPVKDLHMEKSPSEVRPWCEVTYEVLAVGLLTSPEGGAAMALPGLIEWAATVSNHISARIVLAL